MSRRESRLLPSRLSLPERLGGGYAAASDGTQSPSRSTFTSSLRSTAKRGTSPFPVASTPRSLSRSSFADPDDDAGDDAQAWEEQARFQSVRTQQSLGSGSIAKQLQEVKLFQNCSGLFLEALGYHSQEQLFADGAEIIKQGDVGSCMYLLGFGEVDVLINDQRVATLASGSIFGEMAVLSNHIMASKRAATVRAVSVCRCWIIERSSLMKVITPFPRDEAIISGEASRRLKELKVKGFIHEDRYARQWEAREFPDVERRPSRSNSRRESRTQLKGLTALSGRSSPVSPVSPVSHVSSEKARKASLEEAAAKSDEASLSIRPGEDHDVNDAGLSHTCPGTPVTKIDVELPRLPHTCPGSPAGKTYDRLAKSIPEIVLSNYTVGDNGQVVPRSRPSYKTRALAKSWNIGETEAVAKARHSAMEFLNKRGVNSD